MPMSATQQRRVSELVTDAICHAAALRLAFELKDERSFETAHGRLRQSLKTARAALRTSYGAAAEPMETLR